MKTNSLVVQNIYYKNFIFNKSIYRYFITEKYIHAVDNEEIDFWLYDILFNNVAIGYVK